MHLLAVRMNEYKVYCTLPGKHHVEVVGPWFLLVRTEICQRQSTVSRPVTARKLLQRSESMLQACEATAHAA